MSPQEVDEYVAEFIGPTIQVAPALGASFVAVVPDGIDYRIECGLCGLTVRGFAAPWPARDAADRHERECPERDNYEWGD